MGTHVFGWPGAEALPSLRAPSLGVYVYCVVPAAAFPPGTLHLRAPAIGGRGDAIRVICAGDIAAVVSDSPKARYEIRRDAISVHEQVIEEIMQYTDALPVRFGTVADSDHMIEEHLLRQQSAHLLEQLDRIRGRAELGLQALCNQQQLLSRILADDPMIQALHAAVATGGQSVSFQQRLQLGQLTERAVAREREREAQRLLEEIRPLIVEFVLVRPFTEFMILNAAFLVERAGIPAFAQRVSQLTDAGSGYLSFRCVGPLPPYNFVRVTVA